MFLLKRLIRSSKDELRSMLERARSTKDCYQNGMRIGKSHSLIVEESKSREVSVSRHGQHITVMLPVGAYLNSPEIVRAIREVEVSALRVEAKSYLPKRLLYLSTKLGLSYDKVRFSHASGRWGSCSSKGTISLNIALMKLPFELIDYVIIHELSHTRHMNHSATFWKLVESADSQYKQHRRALKAENPSI